MYPIPDSLDNEMKFDVKHFQVPLTDLNGRLEKAGLNLKLTVIGAFALHILKLSGQFTADIDSVDPIESEALRTHIAQVALTHQISDDWINDSASSLDLPAGFFDRIESVSGYSNIELYVASRSDLIALKARAYLHRGEIDPKDLEDLKRLAPNHEEIEFAISFVRATSTPPEADLFPEFESIIEEIRRVAT
jgi:hypothetical protein